MKEWQPERQISEMEYKAIDIYSAGLAGGVLKVYIATDILQAEGLTLVEALREVNKPKEFAIGTSTALAGAIAGKLVYNISCRKCGWKKSEAIETIFMLTGSIMGVGAMMSIGNNTL